MNLAIYSQEQVISDFVQTHLMPETNTSKLSSLILRDSLSDFVRLLMRQAARSTTGMDFQGAALLETSIEKALAHLSQSIGTDNIHVLGHYFPLIRERLKYTAQEMAKLRTEHQKLSENFATKTESRSEVPSSTTFSMTTLRSVDEAQGFWALPVPSDQIIQLDLNYLQSIGQVKGDWFPFEVSVDELNFVIDDDGSVYIPTGHLPEQLVEAQYQKITRVLTGAYIPAKKETTDCVDDIIIGGGPQGIRTPPPEL